MKNPGFENSPSVTMSMPHSACLRTVSLTASASVVAYAVLIVRLAGIFRLHHIEQRMRARQAADMGGLNAVGVLLDVMVVSRRYAVWRPNF